MPDVLVVVPTLGQRLDSLAESLESITSQEGVRDAYRRGGTRGRSTGWSSPSARVPSWWTTLDEACLPRSTPVLRHTRTRLTTWLNDDDFYAPGASALLAGMLESDSDASVAYGACVYVDDWLDYRRESCGRCRRTHPWLGARSCRRAVGSASPECRR